MRPFGQPELRMRPACTASQTAEAQADEAVWAAGVADEARLHVLGAELVVFIGIVLTHRETVVELVVRLADEERVLSRVHHEHNCLHVSVVTLALGKVQLVALSLGRAYKLLCERRLRASGYPDQVAVLWPAVAPLVRAS